MKEFSESSYDVLYQGLMRSPAHRPVDTSETLHHRVVNIVCNRNCDRPLACAWVHMGNIPLLHCEVVKWQWRTALDVMRKQNHFYSKCFLELLSTLKLSSDASMF